jgi:hypothetical protein
VETTLVVKEIPTITNLVPKGMIDKLLYWRDELSRGCWEIGDITNEIYVLAQANKLEVTRSEICAKVGQIVGKSGRTIRLYAEVSAYFPDSIRAEYGILPFSHFSLARTWGSEWQGVLDSSMNYMGEHGNTPSVERLEALVKYGEESPIIPPSYPPLTDLAPGIPLHSGDSTTMVMGEGIVVGGASTQMIIQTEEERIANEIKTLLNPLSGLLERLSRSEKGKNVSNEVFTLIVGVRRVLEALDREYSGVYVSDEDIDSD